MQHCFRVFLAVILVLSAPVSVAAQVITSNFDHFFELSIEQENSLGIITPPDSAVQVAEHRGVPILETESRPFSEDEIAEIKRYLDLVPEKFLETPPKAIIAASKETQGRVIKPTTVATASGPYIFLGTRFFEGGFRSSNTDNDKVSIFMHEYAHVLQHYYLDIEHGTQQSMDDRSALVHDFSVSVGWTARDSTSGPFLSGSDIAFIPDASYRRWQLPESEESGTTKYGQTNNVEDQAESFGWVIAGHPGLVSEARATWVLNFLGESAEAFTKGVIPIHPDALRARGQPRGSQRFFQDLEPDVFQAGEDGQEHFYFFEEESGVSFENAMYYFKDEFAARGFTAVEAMTHQVLDKQEDHASAVYDFDGMTVLVQVIDLTNADAYITKGDMTVRVVAAVQDQ